MRMRRREVFSRRKRVHFMWWVFVSVLVVGIAAGIYSTLDNGRVIVREQRVYVANLPSDLEGFTILHISDLNAKQFGPGQKQLAAALKGKRYNAVCITGDMVGKSNNAYPFYEILSALDPTKPVYFIAGDSDPQPVDGQSSGYYSVLSDWIIGAQSRGATYVDAPASLQVGKSTVWFSDVSQLTLDLNTAAAAYAAADTRESAYYAEVIDRTKLAREQMKDQDLHIVLSHKPLKEQTVLSIQSGERGESNLRTVNLVLSGSTVGGQWVLPFAGPVWYDEWFPDADLVKGYHYVGNVLQYTSAGVGTSGTNPLPDFRLFNSPEVTLITVTSSYDQGLLP